MLFGKAPDEASRPAFLWLVRLIAASAAVLVPWAAYLAVSLPASVSARHWPAAWAGLDVMMSAGLAATAWLAVRRDRRMAFPAAATAALLLADAWFDVCTAPAGGPLLMALADMSVEVVEAAGGRLELSGRLGPPLAYFARLRPDRSRTA
jgi:hypothetical protein